MKYAKHIKLFEEFAEGDQKANVIKEFERLIRINHTVSGDLEKVLSDAYDKGFEIGKLRTLLGSDFSNHPFVKKFKNPDDDIAAPAIKALNPKRISNNRDMTYNAKDISDDSKVMVVDISVEDAIKSMADPHGDYMYFNRESMEKKNHDESMKRGNAEDKSFEEKNYNTLEVAIFIVKCYQVGFSEGELSTNEIPRSVKQVYTALKDIEDYEKGNREFFRDDRDLEVGKNRLKMYQDMAPNWKEYEEFFK